MVESVSESIDAAFAAFEQAAAGEQAGSDEHPAATPQDHQPAAETEPTGDGIRDALEAGWAQLETGARDREALDEVFAPLTGRMAEQKADPGHGRQGSPRPSPSGSTATRPAPSPTSRRTCAPAAPIQIRSYASIRPRRHKASSSKCSRSPPAPIRRIRQFAGANPGFDKVRAACGELMLSAAQAGKEMTLAQAYRQVLAKTPKTASAPSTVRQDLQRAMADLGF